MKITKILLVIFLLLIGYILGSIFPLNIPRLAGKSIEGNTELQVKALTDNGQPIPKLEIDVDVRPGPPSKGGVAATDENGVAVFKLKPGNYVIYFNGTNFPQNLNRIDDVPVTVVEGQVNEKTLYFKAK